MWLLLNVSCFLGYVKLFVWDGLIIVKKLGLKMLEEVFVLFCIEGFLDMFKYWGEIMFWIFVGRLFVKLFEEMLKYVKNEKFLKKGGKVL